MPMVLPCELYESTTQLDEPSLARDTELLVPPGLMPLGCASFSLLALAGIVPLVAGFSYLSWGRNDAMASKRFRSVSVFEFTNAKIS